MALMVALSFLLCGISGPDVQKRQRAVLPSATQPSCHSQRRCLHGKPQQAQKETTATATPSPAAAGRGATPDQLPVYPCPHSLLFPFLTYTVLRHFQTYTPMGLSSFYTYHTLAHFFLKWVIQIFCHSASLPISNRLRLTAAVRKPDNIKRQIAKLSFHSHMTILGVTGGRNTQMSSCLPG